MKNKGFTLIEVIVSLAIIGIIAVGMLTIFNTGLVNIVSAGERASATNLAELNLYEDEAELNSNSISINLPTGMKDETSASETFEVVVNGSLNKGTHTSTIFNRSVKVDIYKYFPSFGTE